MIPRDFITEWRAQAPWVADRQVEQDLVISRALVELFSVAEVAGALAFRGGTALYKLYLRPAARYSEDIDLVQVAPGEIGQALDGVRAALDPWLGEPKWKQAAGGTTLAYRFESADAPPVRLRLKVEINSREHFTVFGVERRRFEVVSRWYSGVVDIPTYCLDELLGTKLRALYQRSKGRDLFDLAWAIERAAVTPERIVEAFQRYMAEGGTPVTRAVVERNLAEKRADPAFAADLGPLLAVDEHSWDVDRGFEVVARELVARLPGAPWKGR